MPTNRSGARIAGLATAVFAACVMLSVARAAEYSWEVAGSHVDGDSGSAVQTNHSALHATWYPSAVDDAVGPFELAPFLNRSSYVTVVAGRTKLREPLLWSSFASDPFSRPADLVGMGIPAEDVFPVFGAPFPAESGVDSSEYAVAGRYVWPDTGWYAGAQVQQSGGDLLPGFWLARSTLDQDSSEVFAGRYFGSRTTLELALGSGDVDQESRTTLSLGIDPLPDFSPFPPAVEPLDFRIGTRVESESARLSVRHAGDFGDSAFAVSASVRHSRSETRLFGLSPFEDFPPAISMDPPDRFFVGSGAPLTAIGFSQTERERELRLSGTLFPTDALGVRLAFSSSDHDTYGTGDTVDLSATWFFVRNAALEIGLSRTDSSRPYGSDSRDMDSIAVRLLGRF